MATVSMVSDVTSCVLLIPVPLCFRPIGAVAAVAVIAFAVVIAFVAVLGYADQVLAALHAEAVGYDRLVASKFAAHGAHGHICTSM